MNHRRWAWLAVSVSLAISSASLLADAATAICKGKNATLRCLKQNVTELYMREYAQFGRILRAAEEKALRCDSVPNTAVFLNLAPYIKGNAEVGEYFSEVVEKKFLPSKSRCLLEALIRTNEETQKLVIDDLRTPTFADESEVRNALSKFRHTNRYQKLLKPYFQD